MPTPDSSAGGSPPPGGPPPPGARPGDGVISLAETGGAEQERSLFRDREFVALWFTQGVTLVVNTALQFVLLILIVEKTGSSVAGSGLIIALAAPPVLLGLVSGVVVDQFDKRYVLMVTTALRGALTILLVVGDGNVASIYAIAFLTSVMGQFFLPAAQSAIPVFVAEHRLLAANSLFQLTQTVAQLMGMVMLAPLMLKALGYDASYVLAGILLLAGVPAIARLRPLPPAHATGAQTWRDRARAAPGELAEAWAVIRHDRITALAMFQLSTGVMLLFMFALLVPRFVVDVLDLPPDNSVFVFWPTGLGALLALRLLPGLGRRYTPTGIVTAALFGLTVSIVAFGAIEFLVDFLQDEQPFGALGPDQVGGVSLLVFITLLLAFPLGVTYALVNAPAQTVLHTRAPQAMQGRVFAAQLMLANAVSMAALLVVGGVADAAGVGQALYAVGGVTLLMALVSRVAQRGLRETVGPPANGAAAILYDVPPEDPPR